MPIITLTTDLEGGSYYLAALKGTLLSLHPQIQLIDITHRTNHFDMRQSSFILQQAAKYYPENTIHVLHVNSSEAHRRLLVAVKDKHYYLIFDNGSGPLVFGSDVVQYFDTEMEEESGALFLKSIYKTARQIIENRFSFRPAQQVKVLRRLQPIYRTGFIKGNISSIDHFGNGITNITREMFEQNISGNFEVAVNSYTMNTIAKDYSGNVKGDVVVFFNSENLLEIAMNQASAEKLLGLKVEGVVTIESI